MIVLARIAPPLAIMAIATAALSSGCRQAHAEADQPPVAEHLELPELPVLELERPDPRPNLERAETIFAATPPPPCPPGMAHIGRYCIDRYEAHLVVRGEGDAMTRHPHNERPPEGEHFEARSAAGVMPQAYISRVEAKLACTNASKRLCGFGEWRRACRSGRGKRYPYGWHGRRGVCNTGKKHLLHEMFGERPWTYEMFNDPKLNAEPGYLAASGGHQECKTEADVFDMNGNLHEWVSSTVTERFVERLEEEEVERVEQPWVVGNGMFLGGFYSTTNQHGPGCLYTTIAHEPTYHDYSTGFRCCADAVR
jgi:Sulfatase-modifying factor enzyme 1